MTLDADTLFLAIAVASAIAALQLFWAWRHNPEVSTLLVWSGGFLLGSCAIGFMLLQSIAGDAVGGTVGQFVFVAAFALSYWAARDISGKSTSPPVILAGPLLWLLASLAPPVAEAFYFQIAISSLLGTAYLIASAVEIWRGPLGLPSQRPTAIFISIHGAVLACRAVIALFHGAAPPTENGLVMGLFLIESLVFISTTTFFIINLVKEQVELRHKTAALLDPLTGIANRRGFFKEAEHLLQSLEGRSVAVLLFDLDKFKEVNDTYGHATGDRILQIFASVLTTNIRKGDIIARLGGEEFAVVMPAGLRRANTLAQTIVTGFAGAASLVDGLKIEATVSAGFAVASGGGQTIDDALRRADQALYRAKNLGRNRAEAAPLPEQELPVRPVRAA